MWCDSPQSARQCDVIRQCERHWNSKTPVKLTLIYEALCPFCQKFITQHLGSLYEEFRNNIELELIPWGNSRFMKVNCCLKTYLLLFSRSELFFIQQKSKPKKFCYLVVVCTSKIAFIIIIVPR